MICSDLPQHRLRFPHRWIPTSLYHLSRFVHDHHMLSPAKIPDARALRRVNEVPLAIIVDSAVSDQVGNPIVAIRIPLHPVARTSIEIADVPLVTCAKGQIVSGFLFDVIFRESLAIFKLLSGEDQAPPIGGISGDSFLV